MKFIHISDVHLGAEPDLDKDWGRDRKKEIQQTFEDIIKICEKDEIDLFLIAGNLFHTVPDIKMLEEVDRLLDELTHTKTVIISGDADYIALDSEAANYRFKSKTVILPGDKVTNAYLKDLNTCVTGFSYARPEYTKRILEEIKPGKKDAINILLGHGGDLTHMPFKKDVLAKKGFDYIALGHKMKPEHILRNKMAYSGSPEPIVNTEIGKRGYIYGETDENGVKIKWIPFSKRSYMNLTIEVSGISNQTDINETIESQILKLGIENIYTIIFKGTKYSSLSLDLRRIKARYNIYDVIDRTISGDDINRLALNNESNITGSYIKNMQGYATGDAGLKERAMRYGIEALIAAGEKNVSE